MLQEVLGSGVWAQDEDDAYLALLAELLQRPPAGGFDVLSDARGFTMQIESSSDDDSYDMLAMAGCRRFIQIVSSTAVGLQTARMIRSSPQGNRLVFCVCTTVEEAEALLAQPG